MRPVTIDARLLGRGGIGSYLEVLLDELPAGAPISVLTRPGTTVPFPARTVRSRVFSLAEQWEVPLAAVKGSILHVPHYNIPLAWRGPLVVTIHDLIHLDFPEHFGNGLVARYARWFMHLAIRRADRILTVSDSTRERLCEGFGVPSERVNVIRNKVRRSLLLAKESEQVPDERLKARPFFLYCGSFRVHKNARLLLEAIKQLSPDYMLVMVVEKPWPDHDAGRVLMMDRISNGLLKFLYKSAIALAFPSLAEGFGLPVLEAMTFGTPVIASDLAALREVASGAAVFVNPSNVGEWAEALRTLAMTPGLRQSMAQKGLQRAAELNACCAGDATQRVYSEIA